VVGTAAAVLVVAVAIFALLFVRLYRVPSVSMEPSLKPGDKLLALKIGGFGRGDIVVFSAPARAVAACGVRGTYVKRVIRLTRDSAVVMGDNRAESCDSRVYGPVSRRSVQARVFFVYWPLNRIGFR
jgi:signal peptidase I